VYLSGLNDKDVTGLALEGLSVDGPDSSPLANELDFIIGMAMRTRPGTRFALEQEYRNAGVALLGSHKLMGAAYKWEILLPHMMHLLVPSAIGCAWCG
jgi:hypothetical protein